MLETIIALIGGSTISYLIARRFSKLKEDNLQESHERNTQQLITDHSIEIQATVKQGKEKAANALKRSKQVRIGLSEENLLLYNENFKYDGGDFRALGSPIDGVVFPGAVNDEITEIVLIEVKTGNSRLSKRQKQIKELVKAGKVRFEEFRIKTKPVVLKHKDEIFVDAECLCSDCVSN